MSLRLNRSYIDGPWWRLEEQRRRKPEKEARKRFKDIFAKSLRCVIHDAWKSLLLVAVSLLFERGFLIKLQLGECILITSTK